MNKITTILTTLIILAMLTLTACEASIPDNRDSPVEYVLSPFEDVSELYSRAAIVVDMNTSEVEFALNEIERMNPASTIKIMTALLTLEIVSKGGENGGLDELVEVPEVVFSGFDTDDPNTVGGSLAGIVAGQENLTYRDCLYGLMLPSGNDAANVLAFNLAGSIPDFVTLMNKKATELGCVNTNFSNAHGLLEEDNWSCAYDLALIAKYAYEEYPLFGEICYAFEYVMPGNDVRPDGYRLRNSNALIRKDNKIYYRNFVRGIKSGSLNYYYLKDENGNWVEHDGINNLVSLGEQSGRSYIVVTLEAPYIYGALEEGESRMRYTYLDHILLYSWLF